MIASRFLLPLAAATVSLGLAWAPAALATDNMQNSAMSKDKMENSSMSKSHAMSKSTMTTTHKAKGKTHKMSDGKMSNGKMSDDMKK